MRDKVEWGFDQYVDEDEVGRNEPSYARVISRVYKRGVRLNICARDNSEDRTATTERFGRSERSRPYLLARQSAFRKREQISPRYLIMIELHGTCKVRVKL